jgi:hypothetical protein
MTTVELCQGIVRLGVGCCVGHPVRMMLHVPDSPDLDDAPAGTFDQGL